jgi:hypothetical protein
MKNSTATVICISCLTLAAAMISYDYWARNDIYERLTEVDVRRVSVGVLNCSKYHFWGHLIYYRDDDTGVPGDVYVHVGRACYDRATGEWELTQDIDWQ